VFVYIDDLLVVSDSFESHLKVVRVVAGYIKTADLTLNVEKSTFCIRLVKYLVHIVGCNKDRSGKNICDDRFSYQIR